MPSSARKTIVYVDGFNLYYGSLKGTPYRWLNLLAFSQAVLGTGHDIQEIKYFTAPVRQRFRMDQGPDRQALYIRALRTLHCLTVYQGHFLEHIVELPLADRPPGPPEMVRVVRTDEKGTDVSLATELVADAYEGAFEAAVVISNDSDQVAPIRLVCERLNVPVGVLLPAVNGSRQLKEAARFFKDVRPSKLAASQFSYELRDKAGRFSCPPTWRS